MHSFSQKTTDKNNFILAKNNQLKMVNEYFLQFDENPITNL